MGGGEEGAGADLEGGPRCPDPPPPSNLRSAPFIYIFFTNLFKFFHNVIVLFLSWTLPPHIRKVGSARGGDIHFALCWKRRET